MVIPAFTFVLPQIATTQLICSRPRENGTQVFSKTSKRLQGRGSRAEWSLSVGLFALSGAESLLRIELPRRGQRRSTQIRHRVGESLSTGCG